MVFLLPIDGQERIKPSLKDNVEKLIQLDSFSYASRQDGNDKFTFKVRKSKNLDDFIPGKIYFVYADIELTKLLCSFKLQNAKFDFDNSFDFDNQRTTTLECLSTATVLLNRTKISFTFRNIRFKEFLTSIANIYRERVPEISNDYQFIEDLDVIFPLQKKRNTNLEEVFKSLRSQGFQVFLRPDLRIQAGQRSFLPAFNADLNLKAIGSNELLSGSREVPEDIRFGNLNRDVIDRNQDSWVTKTFNADPITSLIARGGNSEDGAFESLNVITNKESTFDLEKDVNFQDNFLLEPFNTSRLEGFSVLNKAGIGWLERQAVLDTPITFRELEMLETELQILDSSKEAYFLGIGNGKDFFPDELNAGFYIANNSLNVISNGQINRLDRALKPFRSINILSVSEDFKTFELESVQDLVIGDKVSVSGTNTAITLGLSPIVSIDGNFVTLEDAATEGEFNDSLKLFRVTTYELRIILNRDGLTEYYIRQEAGDFELIGTFSIVYPPDRFITAFNCLELPTFTVDNGVWEVGGYAINYFFFDKAVLFKAYDQFNNKIIAGTTDTAQSVDTQLILNNVSKNGVSTGQVQFVAPTYIKIVLDEEITLSKIPLAFNTDDQLRVGMRVLIGNEARLIESFNVAKNGFIILNEPLSVLPVPLETLVHINTSIPVDDTNFFLEYVPNIPLVLRVDAPDEALNQFGVHENSPVLDLSEFTNAALLAERMRLFLIEQLTPVLSGQLVIRLNFNNFRREGYLNISSLPALGEYIQVVERKQNIILEPAKIEALQVQSENDEGFFTLIIELGETGKTNVIKAVLELRKRLGIEIDSVNDVSCNIPPVQRDKLAIQDVSIELIEFEPAVFVSGGVYGYSTNSNKSLSTEDVSIELIEFEPAVFVSGGVYGYSTNSNKSLSTQDVSIELIEFEPAVFVSGSIYGYSSSQLE